MIARAALLCAVAVAVLIGNVHQNVQREPYLGGEQNVQANVAAVYWVLSPLSRGPVREPGVEVRALGSWSSSEERVPKLRPSPVATDVAPADLRAIVCSKEWDWSCEWAIGVVACESGWRPGVVNPAGPYLGLFQIWIGHLRPGGILEGMTEIELLAAEGNIRAAHSIYKVQGPGAWPRCGR